MGRQRHAAWAWLLVLLGGVAGAQTVSDTLDGVTGRLFESLGREALFALDDAAIQAALRPEERAVLATRHQYFEVSAPAIISVMRDTAQEVVPFWLGEAGFEKTGLTVTNTENWVYEVWQKRVDAGLVELGINGFDRHRPHYFVAVGPQDPGQPVRIDKRHPAAHGIGWMHEGALVYHDWDSLLLKTVPKELRGHQLLRTIRGRAREAHLIQGFRETPHPSGPAPDQIMLTWSGDPRSTQTVQWRTDTGVEEGVVRFRPVDAAVDQWQTVPAERARIEDRQLVNDPVCHRHTAVLRGLSADTEYVYQVGDSAGVWSEAATFRTAPDTDRPFSFITFGDTHKKPSWGRMLERAQARHPEAAFHIIAGDQVDTGQFRSDWDEFFDLSKTVFNRRPVLPAIGNHDEIDGLGAGVYRSMFALPENGPAELAPENAYSLRYGNLLVLVLHSGDPVVAQAAWLEEQLANTDAVWKIAVFHFPPYNYEEPYPEIRALWGYLFDKYHVDFALTGHIHYYMRSHPIRADRPREDPSEGTIHVLSIAIENGVRDLPPADYAAVQLTGVPLYQHFEVDGRRLVYTARDADGVERDRLEIQK